jgi:hypothetical protein
MREFVRTTNLHLFGEEAVKVLALLLDALELEVERDIEIGVVDEVPVLGPLPGGRLGIAAPV